MVSGGLRGGHWAWKPHGQGKFNSEAEAQLPFVFLPKALFASNGFGTSGPNLEDIGATRKENKGTGPSLSQRAL